MEQEPTQKTSETTNEATTTPESSGVKEQTVATNYVYIIAAVVLLLVAGVVYFAWNSDSSNSFQTEDQVATSSAAKDYPEVVATVNGEDVPQDAFLQSITQTQALAVQQGANPEDPAVQVEIESQALDIVVNTVLLVQAAQAAEVTVTEEAIDAEVAQLQTQFGEPELLQAELDRMGMTEEDLRSDLEEQLLINAYIEANVNEADLAVTDEEVATTYETLAQQNEQMPALADVQEQVREQLVTQKRQEIVGQLIDSLKAEATIELFI